MAVKHRGSTPSLLAGFARPESVPQSPIRVGTSSPIYLSDLCLGEGKCLEAGKGSARLIGYMPLDNPPRSRIWEAQVPYLDFTRRAEDGFTIPDASNVKYHPRGSPGYHTLSRRL